MGQLQKILVLGTGNYAPVLAEVISETQGFELAGFIENLDRSRCGQKLLNLPVYWIDDLSKLDAKEYKAVCSLATTKRADFIKQVSDYGFEYATIIHPSCRIPDSCKIGVGCVLEPGVILSTNSVVCDHVRINRAVSIGHDTVVKNYVTIQPGSNIAGFCLIDSCSYIGMGSTIIDGLTIGKDSVVGAGSVVVSDVMDKVLVLGVPARVIKENIDGK